MELVKLLFQENLLLRTEVRFRCDLDGTVTPLQPFQNYGSGCIPACCFLNHLAHTECSPVGGRCGCPLNRQRGGLRIPNMRHRQRRTLVGRPCCLCTPLYCLISRQAVKLTELGLLELKVWGSTQPQPLTGTALHVLSICAQDFILGFPRQRSLYLR